MGKDRKQGFEHGKEKKWEGTEDSGLYGKDKKSLCRYEKDEKHPVMEVRR